MLYTKNINEVYASDEPELERYVLEKTLALYQDQHQIGEVIQILYPDGRYQILQAEMYYEELPSDLFFEKGLVHREHAYEPLQAKPLKGIVISKRMGMIYRENNHFLIKPRDFEEVLEVITYQENNRESFAEYRSSGNSGIGFIGCDYQPLGPDISGRNKKYLRKGPDLDSIVRETEHSVENSRPTVIDFFNGEKVSASFKLKNGTEAVIERNSIGLLLQENKEGIHLNFKQIPALRKSIQLYYNHQLLTSTIMFKNP